MFTSYLSSEYLEILKKFSTKRYFGLVAISHILKKPELKNEEIKAFYKEHALVSKNKIISENYIDVNKDEHPIICGGVTEYLTKIRLARRMNIGLEELRFFDDIKKKKYLKMSDEELAFALYEPDVFFRSGMKYTQEILDHKALIISKAKILSDVSINLIDKEFPIINSIDFHPEGHVMYNGRVAVNGDSDLLINNCLIDFKTKKESSISLDDRAQLFAYTINKYMRDGQEYDKVYVLNPRHYYICELINESREK